MQAPNLSFFSNCVSRMLQVAHTKNLCQTSMEERNSQELKIQALNSMYKYIIKFINKILRRWIRNSERSQHSWLVYTHSVQSFQEHQGSTCSVYFHPDFSEENILLFWGTDKNFPHSVRVPKSTLINLKRLSNVTIPV